VLYNDMAAVRAAANASKFSRRFFGDDNMAEWNMRVLDDVYDAGAKGALFVTSDQPDRNLPRSYTVRHISPDGEIKALDGTHPDFPGVELYRTTAARAKDGARNMGIAARMGDAVTGGEQGRRA
jgi:hypothetical protein